MHKELQDRGADRVQRQSPARCTTRANTCPTSESSNHKILKSKENALQQLGDTRCGTPCGNGFKKTSG